MSEDGDAPDGTVEALRERLAEIEAALEAAETEPDLDEVEAEIEALEADLEDADLPEPEDEDEDGPQEELEGELEDLESDLEDARGPYAEDVVAEVDDVKGDIESTRWTEEGETELLDVVRAALDEINDILGTALRLEDDEELTARLIATLEATGVAIEDADLDPDDDAETIDALLAMTDELADGVDDATAWDDLTVREQLTREGYYDVLEHVKDYPPELHALKIHEKRHNVDMVLLAYETFDSDFMEEHALNALARLGDEAAIEPLKGLIRRRDTDAIRVLGKIGAERDDVVDGLLNHVDAESNPSLQKATLRALGEIGAEDAVQPIANQLVSENPDSRSAAARALGLIGDTRAIEPLAEVLESDEDDTVRGSAAWALNQIGTEEALEAVAEFADDRAYLVQSEAKKADLEPAA